MTRNTHIQISIPALAHNLAQVKKLAPHAKVLAMVKANAYGHGVENAVCGFAKADALGVACMAEATELRELGWGKPICLIEGVFSLNEWQQAQAMNTICVIHHEKQLMWALEHPHTKNKQLWLKVNTGMNRLGFNTSTKESTERIVKSYNMLLNAGYDVVLISHFANADEEKHTLNAKQKQQFDRLLQEIRKANIENNGASLPIKTSVCNSAGIVNWQERHADWVRPGIMLYGASPVNHKTAKACGLKPAMRFSAQVIATHELKKGDLVGYGSTWQAPEDCSIGIVSVGYGDGYPRVITNGQVFIANRASNTQKVTKPDNTNIAKQNNLGSFYNIIGRVSMDMLAIDITQNTSDLENNSVCINDSVELWGENLAIDAVAKTANTIAYELMCRLTQRPSRTTSGSFSF